MFKVKTEYYLKLLTSETIKLCGSAKSEITKNENGKNVSNLEIIEVVLGHLILSIITINKIQELRIHLFQMSHFVNC